MSIADNLKRISDAKAAIKQSLVNKGVEVSDEAKLDEYPALIDSIEVGGGEGGNPLYEAHWNLKTKNNTDYAVLFSNYTGTELDVSNLDTSNVTNMSNMFYNCTNLTSLDISNFNTTKVTTMYSMFFSCNNLTQLDVSNFNTSNMTDMGYMFQSCKLLKTLDVSNFNTSNVTNMTNMFNSCQLLSSLDVSNFNTTNVTNMSNMFAKCNKLTSLDLSNFDTSNVTNISGMFQSCSSLHTLRLDNCSNDTIRKIITSSSFPTKAISGVTRTIYCKESEAAGLTPPTNWVFSYVAEEEPPVEDIPLYVPGEFEYDTIVTEVEVMVDESHDNLSNMFHGCSNLVSVNTEDWDTSNVTNMGYMFQKCTSLTSIDVSNWDTSNVTDMSSIFQGCTSLTQLNLSNFYTNNLTIMDSMFNGCISLTTLDLSNWDATFAYMPDWDMRDMFLGCNSLHTLRLDNCSKDTISKIIKTIGFPTGAISGVTRTIYCKESEATGLKAPTNWVFSYVD